ncbi:uncharacterized protein LOC112538899 [Tetranychus urticae]|uniref:Gustatory receptor n=1 Tax=Tetranychus urticae TaxID=32264 RepID=T1KAK7_TETUR|nr:uncharacterized protein LOC112538899 [Tetranychus urticae]
MNTSNENGMNRASKAGIITWALLTDRKNVILLIAFGLAVDGLSWIRYFASLPGKFDALSPVLFGIQKCIYSVFIVLLCVLRNDYYDQLTQFERKTKLQPTHTTDRYLTKNRFIFKVYWFLYIGNFVVMGSYLFIKRLQESRVNVNVILFFGSTAIGFFGSLAFFRFFIEACLYIHTCFMRVEHSINTLNNSTSALSIGDIRKVRRLYCFAVETTEKLNSLFMLITAIYFVFSTIKSHFSLVRVIHNPSPIIISICMVEFSYYFLVTYHMIYINHLATRIYQSVYSLTYKTDSLFANKEVHLFLLRIERADVGFTFLDLFVITPTCVTSLATISLTIALATPALLK